MLSAFDTVSELEPLCFPGAGRFENSTLGSTPLAVRVVVSGDSCQANRVMGSILTPGKKKRKGKREDRGKDREGRENGRGQGRGRGRNTG